MLIIFENTFTELRRHFPIISILFFAALVFCFHAVKAQDTLASVETPNDTLQVFADSTCETVVDTQWIRGHSNLRLPVIPVNRRHHGQWLFYFFIVQLVILTYVRVAYARSLGDLLRGFLNVNISQQLSREQEVSMPFSAFLLNANFVLSVGVFCYLLINHYLRVPEFSFQLFLFIQFFVLFVIAMKYGALKLTGIVFPFKEELDYFNFNFFLNLKLLGIILLPLNLFIAYSPAPFNNFAVILSMLITGLLLVMIIQRGFQYGWGHLRLNKVHFFLYICTLEIAPVLILVKVISEWLS